MSGGAGSRLSLPLQHKRVYTSAMNGDKEDKKHSIFHFMMAGTLCNEEDFDV